MARKTTKTRSTDHLLPVPRPKLLELGLTDEQVDEALRCPPQVIAFQADQQPGSWFDVSRAQRALNAIGAFKHTKGRWAGMPMKLGQGLDPWQVVWVLAPVFGWVYHDPDVNLTVRVIRTVWFEVPRKNGKSTLSSAISGVLLLADREAGGEVYNAAGSTQQAERVFADAKRMLMTSRVAAEKCRPLKTVVEVPHTGSILRVLSRVAETAHGLNVSGAVVDEIHTLRLRRALVEAIETGTGARDQPLVVFITTADEAEDGTIYDEKHKYTRNVANNVVQDPSHYGVIWAAVQGVDDPFSEETWRKTNPGLGKSPTLKAMRDAITKAKTTPTFFPSYCRLHLNMRMRDQALWLDIDKWDTLSGYTGRTALMGRRAWGGLDLSAVSDFTAWTVWVESVTPGRRFDLLSRFWVPEDRVETLSQQLMVPLADWIADGYVTATPGDVIDYSAIKAAVIGDSMMFDMQRIGYDRMYAGQLVQDVQKAVDGVEIVPVSQTYLGLSAACKELERMVGAKEFAHGANPVLRWMASVVEVKKDDSDNMRPVKPDRRKSTSRIDGITAAVTALDGIVRSPVESAGDGTVLCL